LIWYDRRSFIKTIEPKRAKVARAMNDPHTHPHTHAHSHSHHSAAKRPPLRQRVQMAAYKVPSKYSDFIARMLARAKDSLREEFRGITADGTVQPGLFPVRSTGLSLAPMVRAAHDFLATLDAPQRRRVSFAIDSKQWRSWSNVHPFLMRDGLGLYELAPAQREAALALVSSGLSSSGFESARDVMKLNEHARELTGSTEEYSEWYYWISIFGAPSSNQPWGWQIDGHHLIINCFILGDQLVLTPHFMGSEPVLAEWGKYAGTEVLRAEESVGLAMMRGLSAEQQKMAIIDARMPGEVLATAYNDNLCLPYAGLRYDDLTAGQQGMLRDLIGVYLNRMRPGHAEIRLEEALDHLRETRFSWIGAHDDHGAFYYRIHSPVMLIEFDHEPGIVYANNEPTRDHIHTVVRTPNGNDYGRDLLRQHYAQHDHSHPHTPHRRGLD
jgi:Protein of unknown function (DUF3500)